jgi:hypothetical protein
MDPRVFPTALIVLDFAAAVVWAMHANPRQTVYWIAAGVLTLTVTW